MQIDASLFICGVCALFFCVTAGNFLTYQNPCTILTLPSTLVSHSSPLYAFKVLSKYTEESCACRWETIFSIFLEMKGFFGPGGKCFLYHDVAVEHQECNIVTNWLSVADENEEGFPLSPAALICLGRTFVVPGGLVQEQIKRELKKKLYCCLPKRAWFIHMFWFPPGMVCIMKRIWQGR